MMPTPTLGAKFDTRVLIEVVTDGAPRRVNVWTLDGETYFAFSPDTTEAEATEIVAKGLGLIRPLDVPALFSKRRRRFIEPD